MHLYVINFLLCIISICIKTQIYLEMIISINRYWRNNKEYNRLEIFEIFFDEEPAKVGVVPVGVVVKGNSRRSGMSVNLQPNPVGLLQFQRRL